MIAAFLHAIVGVGFFSSEPVRTAMIIGAGAAVVSAVVGVFTVIRGQSFAGHALGDISSAGGSASFLLGINPLIGFLGMAALGALGMEAVKVQRPAERDLVTGIVMGAGLGLSALLLFFNVTMKNTTGAAMTIMFGSMFAIDPAIVPLGLAIGCAVLAMVGILYRPLLLCSLDADIARIQGVPVRLVGLIHLVMLSMAVALSSITVGAVLSTALLIGPAATALRLAKRPGWAIALAVLIGLVATWGGILLAYDSYDWTPGHGWPVSFFIVSLVFVFYLAARFVPRSARHAPLALEIEGT